MVQQKGQPPSTGDDGSKLQNGIQMCSHFIFQSATLGSIIVSFTQISISLEVISIPQSFVARTTEDNLVLSGVFHILCPQVPVLYL